MSGVRKLKPVEAGDGSYGGMVLEAFDRLGDPAEMPVVDLKAQGAQILNHALVIADGAVRSDIECCAKLALVPAEHGQGFWAYSLTETIPLWKSIPEAKRGDTQCVNSLEDAADNLRIVQRAAAYIRLRGEAWSWQMVDVEGMPGYVRFVSREQPPA